MAKDHAKTKGRPVAHDPSSPSNSKASTRSSTTTSAKPVVVVHKPSGPVREEGTKDHEHGSYYY
ncbi:hypothetical protein LTR56_014767 [Elasticomyces elasticus]|uniref:Uncharacterized protein n=1 Tax=Elasticomyces elasticus TaxID=574655 RepID=A0AAN7WB47_9PEZI|nr:hypothetical protein LTR56_014767 [Elasticomyces elasticus]KAK3638833.1 hypothetical protein LTR22_017684 [Elasticomyces elasticus]KAK4913131.1 hypothetical protein LTR49_018496 [Elasticomyces elasticus]KAK5700930.1 hypothetical protein LTR97_005448 [Elasticomyces elasticus]KAK5728810.1 hypothetical protein LTR15_001950 [Elasticomyces elasticus]